MMQKKLNFKKREEYKMEKIKKLKLEKKRLIKLVLAYKKAYDELANSYCEK